MIPKNEIEEVKVPTKDPWQGVVFMNKYVNDNPCSCGRSWQKETHIPPDTSGISIMSCICSNCSKRKKYKFRIR